MESVVGATSLVREKVSEKLENFRKMLTLTYTVTSVDFVFRS